MITVVTGRCLKLYEHPWGQIPGRIAPGTTAHLPGWLDRHHPTEIPGLVQELRARTPADAHVRIGTVSVYVVELFDLEDVWCVTGDRAARLAKHPDAERHRAYLTTGEFWSTCSDDWIAACQCVHPSLVWSP